MKKRILALCLAILLVGALFAGCGDDGIVTEEKAKEMAMKEAGIQEADIEDVHVHLVTENGLPCYSVHITTADKETSIVIDIASGEIIG